MTAFLESYFASTTEILISFSVSLRSNAPPSATPDTAEYFAVAEPGAEAAYYELPREFGRHIAAGGTAVRCPGGSGCEAYAMEGAGLTRLESREFKAGYERFGREYSIEVYWC